MTEDHHETEGMEDALNSELDDGPKSQDSGLRRRELSLAPSTPFTGPLIVAMEQPMQEANGDTLLKIPVTPADMKAEARGKRALLQVFCSLPNS